MYESWFKNSIWAFWGDFAVYYRTEPHESLKLDCVSLVQYYYQVHIMSFRASQSILDGLIRAEKATHEFRFII